MLVCKKKKKNANEIFRKRRQEDQVISFHLISFFIFFVTLLSDLHLHKDPLAFFFLTSKLRSREKDRNDAVLVAIKEKIERKRDL